MKKYTKKKWLQPISIGRPASKVGCKHFFYSPPLQEPTHSLSPSLSLSSHPHIHRQTSSALCSDLLFNYPPPPSLRSLCVLTRQPEPDAICQFCTNGILARPNRGERENVGAHIWGRGVVKHYGRSGNSSPNRQ